MLLTQKFSCNLCLCNTAVTNPKSKISTVGRTRIKSLVNRPNTVGVLRVASEERPNSFLDVTQYVDFLYEDLPHLFDERGIDREMYDDKVRFRDPITKHDTIDGYLFNIALLKLLFSPQFYLHWVKQTGPYEITTRWTMIMIFFLLPWRPELVFTGISVMSINPVTGKFCSHVDYWDSVKKNQYFSVEALFDVLRQVRIYKMPNLETPKYQILRRTSDYEVRQYGTFLVVETKGSSLSGSSGFNSVAGYIFGKNSSNEKFRMTTPVFTEALNGDPSEILIKIVLPPGKELSSLPIPREGVCLQKVGGGVAAVVKFSGEPTEPVVIQKEKMLRTTLLNENLKPTGGFLLARYNDPGSTLNFLKRNEVLIWLEEFTLV